MRVFAIGDLHLSLNNPKPMNIFGPAWDNYFEKIEADWRANAGAGDVVLLPGDISWAMRLEDAVPDLKLIADLPGIKVILRGNHDYWWKSISAVRDILPAGMYAVQNDALRFGEVVICGSRLWTAPEREGVFKTPEDRTIYLREAERLKLSLSAAAKIRKAGDITICMTHYPPFNTRRLKSDYTALISGAGVDACVYGHLHGLGRPPEPCVIDGVTYRLTSCDMTGNKLVRVF